MAPYASGCYLPGQPVTLQRLPVGNFALNASVRSADGEVAAAHVIFGVTSFFGASSSGSDVASTTATPFVPSYDWQSVAEGQAVPSGLEVHMDLDGSHRKRARIPPSWRLQLYVDHAGFLRTDVGRTYTVAQLEAAAQARFSTSTSASCFGLWASAEPLVGERTAEEARLFERRAELSLKPRPCEPADGAHDMAGEAGGSSVRATSRQLQLVVAQLPPKPSEGVEAAAKK